MGRHPSQTSIWKANNQLEDSDQADQPIPDPKDQREAFARVFAQHSRWLYAYLVTLLGSPSHAEEVFQEVCVILWREYETFDIQTDFRKWASVISHNQVRRFRRLLSKSERLLSDEVLEMLVLEGSSDWDLMDARREALAPCLRKLSEQDQRLVRLCYADSGVSFKTVAESLGRPANTVYKAMIRIRRSLRLCIDRTLAGEATFG